MTEAEILIAAHLVDVQSGQVFARLEAIPEPMNHRRDAEDAEKKHRELLALRSLRLCGKIGIAKYWDSLYSNDLATDARTKWLRMIR